MRQVHHAHSNDDETDVYLDLVTVILRPMEPEYRIAWLRANTPKTAALLANSRSWENFGAEVAS